MVYPGPVLDNVVFSNTTNLIINSLSIIVTDGTATVLTVNANTFSLASNSTGTNSTLIINATYFYVGNSTSNCFSNSTMDVIFLNSTANISVSPTSINFNANSTASMVVNSLGLHETGTVNAASYTVGTTFTANSTVVNAGTNTMLHSGVSSIAGNGYSWLTNGLLLQWGQANITTTPISQTFPVAFPTSCFMAVASGNSAGNQGAGGGMTASVLNVNSTAVGIGQSGNQSGTHLANWMALGH